MEEYIEIFRRHGITAKGKDGKKLDSITQEAYRSAEEQGRQLGAEYPAGCNGSFGYAMSGRYATTNRAKETCNALMHGAREQQSLEIIADSGLDNFPLSNETRDVIRNTPDENEQYRILFTEYIEPVKQRAYEMAQQVYMNLKQKLNSDDGKKVAIINVTHGPAIDAIYQILAGNEVNYENVQKTGFIKESTGFEISLESSDYSLKYPSRYTVVLRKGEDIKRFSMHELEKRVGLALPVTNALDL